MTKINQLWRKNPTSEHLTSPRVMARVFIHPGELENSINFYEKLQQVEIDGFFPFPEHQLRLAMVGAFLIIEGPDEKLTPFTSTHTTLLVNDVQPYYDLLVDQGATIIFPLQDVPTGRAFNAIHPDGTVIEYVHHRPNHEGK
ncbi:VOC family protein [Providencia burhodogranariea]|uniref:Glyoxalase/bleomycin resistance protein/dioxygenase n=1 Tax=Providencia burhodogranariea DSM 19968 TaxID=1141662 RepID=K8WQS7_9GAMM|nr:glyoxalase/bleomycin resistance protein/dioxygenase [Providencia burhodogranariea]EKT62959.1 glyoxalase/bleomycin resistance protein/dioxygenase [Providencia burhodogranariea DSM 19968]